MFEALLRRMRFRSAAQKYAQYLPEQLQKDYGASEFYTPKQIEMSVHRAGLPSEFTALAYAWFMKEEDFTPTATPVCPYGYRELRSILKAFAPARPVSAGFSPASWPSIQGEQPTSGP